MPPWNSAKAKVQLRLSVQRLRTLQEKKEAQAKSARRDIASLVERGKIETARIKVEGIIGEDIHLELLELLELYCEVLLARFGVLDQNAREPDPAVIEGVCSIIYAAPRTELKELNVLREILMHKYGRDFSAMIMENRGSCVSDRVVRKLDIATPSTELVDAYLAEITKAYGVPWSSAAATNGGEGPEGSLKEAAAQSDMVLPDIEAKAASTISTTPKLPDIPPTEDENKKTGSAKEETHDESTKIQPTQPEDDFDLLTKRFAALKRG
ncbi:DUF292-domain-containing protein [Lentinula edodes]|uniref:DUF292-domain-containing protein n=1 Tax=Lentinula edodes TaxID=5353 RepID=UPI001BF75000|nr:DUF292-domain-containing protein [Lentinula edodes]KAF8831901.1 hypothetical protein HHX47_DHR1001162 [Lentinula edodes]KAH7881179.1 DUF292-domain-containing protein [Lentinula edodes]